MQSPRVRMRKELLRSSFFFSTGNEPSWNQLKTFLRNISYKASLFNAIADPSSSNSKPSDSDSINPKTSLPVIDAAYLTTNALVYGRACTIHLPHRLCGKQDRPSSKSMLLFLHNRNSLPKLLPTAGRVFLTTCLLTTYSEQYRNPWNQIRMGKLVEDLDALAGTIVFKASFHISAFLWQICQVLIVFLWNLLALMQEDGTARPLILVTASVDKMVLKKPILIDIDLTIGGAVAWVGRSSMEIQLELIQSTQGNVDTPDSQALVANFTFVARDSATGKSALINQISPETEHERFLWEEAEQSNRLRKLKRAEYKHVQNGDTARLSALLAEGRIFSDMPALANRDSILIKDTCLENSFVCQPQQRNIHGRIFGGFLMRRAFELAFSIAYVFAGAAPHFLEVDHVDFFKPVDVGNFLRLKSCVLYTEHENLTEPRVNVEVVALVTKPELRSSEVSNGFYFTFAVNPEAIKGGLRIRHVVPATEEEAIKVLERMDVEDSQV